MEAWLAFGIRTADLVILHSFDMLRVKTQVCKYTNEYFPLFNVFWQAYNICLVGNCLWAVSAFSIRHAVCSPCLHTEARDSVCLQPDAHMANTCEDCCWPHTGVVQEQVMRLAAGYSATTHAISLLQRTSYHYICSCRGQAKQPLRATCAFCTLQPPHTLRSVELKV